MAMIPDGKVVCPTCGARSKTDGFGKEVGKDGKPIRTSAGRKFLSTDPVIVERRSRARAISMQNRGILA